MILPTTFIYNTVPTYFGVLRKYASRVGSKNVIPYQDDKKYRIGFMEGQNIHCVEIKTVRGYYNAVYAKEKAAEKEAAMYERDIRSILQESDKSLN